MFQNANFIRRKLEKRNELKMYMPSAVKMDSVQCLLIVSKFVVSPSIQTMP